MVNYQLSKVYKIVCNITGLTYVGSTCEPTLARRLVIHRDKSKQYFKGNSTYYTTSYRVLENNNYEIILLEDYPCENRDQLRSRERYYIETLECVNVRIEGRTSKEWYEDNKEKVKERSEKYRNENKNKIKETKKAYCEKNKEEIKKTNQEYYQENKEQITIKQKEYNEKNKEKIIAIMKSYSDNHKEQIQEYNKNYYINTKEISSQKVNCICGSCYRKSSKSQHEKTKKHIKFIEEQNSATIEICC